MIAKDERKNRTPGRAPDSVCAAGESECVFFATSQRAWSDAALPATQRAAIA